MTITATRPVATIAADEDFALFELISETLGLDAFDGQDYVLYLMDANIQIELPATKAPVNRCRNRALHTVVAETMEISRGQASREVKALRNAGVTIELPTKWEAPSWLSRHCR